MPPPLPNLAIKASAGAGKTFTLVTRLVALLGAGVPLERLLALTFTRAAAGEIFDALVERLAAAAATDTGATQENRRLATAMPGLPPHSRAEFATILRRCLETMHRSAIGTLDSFFASIVQSFPLELGISPDFTLLTDHAQAAERQAILRQLLGGDAKPAERRAFLEAFKRATFGRESKRCHDLLDEVILEFHARHLQTPAPRRWGDPTAIFGGRPPWTLEPPAALSQASAQFLASLDSLTATPHQRQKLAEWATALGELQPAGQLAGDVRDVLKDCAAALPALECGDATIANFKKVAFPPPTQQAMATLTRHGLACLLQAALENTRGLHELLAHYEAAYERRVRQAGKLTFADLTLLLTRDQAPALTQNPQAAGNGKLDVEYRLDGRFDHWALDEFQDTSRPQWHAIAGLADELLQDPGSRSFFMVGDIKQAIYGWRSGDSRLMPEIIARYALKTQPLDESWRSGPPVLALVNAICGRFAETPGLAAAARDRWRQLWAPHESRKPDLPGCAFVLESTLAAREAASDEAANGKADAVIAELRRVRPWERGLTAAVLVRSNAKGGQLTAALHEAGIPVVWEGEKAIADQPLVAALLAWCRWLEHPGDRLALEHLRMSPLRHLLGTDDAAALRAGLRRLHTDGFAAALRHWLRELAANAAIRPEEADAPELQTLLAAAGEFDANGGRGGREFTDFIESYSGKELAPANRVQVMTIHHSKGLGFDLVLLPLEETEKGIATLQDELLIGETIGAAGPEVAWLLRNPGFLADLEDAGPLQAALHEAQAAKSFEALCTLYVALTRAKQELAIILDRPPQNSQAVRLATLVRNALPATPADGATPAPPPGLALPANFTCRHFTGAAAWFERAAAPAAAAPEPPPPPPPTLAPPRPRHPRRLPSAAEARELDAALLFRPAAPAAAGGKLFGSALHQLFQELEWPETEPAEAVIARWRARQPAIPPEIAAAGAAQFRQNLADPAIRAALARPAAPGVTLWRERSFDLILDGAWVTGTFDRAVIETDATGRPQHATLLDFKSDRVADSATALAAAAATYAPQLRLYRGALAALLGLPPAAIHTALLFTAPGRFLPLDP
ncbi:MAG: UvrD-helicase domain-containing protein [Lentisphaeria bacterium]|jgi:ATP-dependent exoDNAse (exonuclease V) beta subunit